MEVQKKAGGILQLRHELEELDKPYLLISDVHFDNPKCDRELLKKHFDQAKEKGAGILIFGDFFCAMQGRHDRRGNKSDIRPENQRIDYFDSLVEEAVEWLMPYKDNLVMISAGNHESAILQNGETDILKRTCLSLGIEYGAYQGFIRFHHKVTSTSTRSTTLFFHHGNWGGIISKGTQSVSRFASIAPDANIVVTGHTHDRWIVEHPQYRLTQNGTTKLVNQLHIKCGTYKEEFLGGKGNGWAVQKITMPKSLGGWWLHFEAEDAQIRYRAVMT